MERASYERPLKRSRVEATSQRLPIKRANGTFVHNPNFNGAQQLNKPIQPPSSDEESDDSTKKKQDTGPTAGSIRNLNSHDLEKRRYRIKLEMGDVCEQILQAPGKAVRQNRSGPSLMDQVIRWCKDPDDEIGRLGLISGHLVFNDILPSYRIRIASDAEMGSQMKKETRQLREFERRLLDYYQRYLKCAGNEIQANPNGTKNAAKSAAAVHCLSELLKTRPTFNFRSNIISVLIPLMGSMSTSMRIRHQRGMVKSGKYSKRRRSNVAVIIVKVIFISAFLFYCLLLNHSFPTNPNKITNCFKLFTTLQLHLLNASLFDF